MIGGPLRFWLRTGSAALVVGACGASQPLTNCKDGAELCPCKPDKKCNTGLECRSNICVESDANLNTDTATPTNVTSGAQAESSSASNSGGATSVGAQSTSGQGGVVIFPVGARAASNASFTANASSTTGSDVTQGFGGASAVSGGANVTGGGGALNCPEMEYEATNLYIMLDASTSMVDSEVDDVTRWQFVTDGIRAFLEEPGLERVHISLQFFGWISEASCDVLNYSLPEVALGDIADVADDIALALEDQVPGGLTPTYPALSGALSYAGSFAQLNPTHYNAVVFITDGYPTRCEPMDLSSIADLAMQARALCPSVATHVIGIDDDYNMDQVAMAGGSGRALVLRNTGNAGPMRDALVAIATDPLVPH